MYLMPLYLLVASISDVPPALGFRRFNNVSVLKVFIGHRLQKVFMGLRLFGGLRV